MKNIKIMNKKWSNLVATVSIAIALLFSLLYLSAVHAGPPATAEPIFCASPVYQVARSQSQFIRIDITGSAATFTEIVHLPQ